MAVTVADSDVLIDALHGRPPAMERIANELRAGSLATTSITLFELLSAAKTRSSENRIRSLLKPILILSLDERAADMAAALRRQLEALGTGVGMADYLIAGICLSRSASLLTRNKGHFQRIPGLLVQSP